jgi:hypothetical protein
VVGMGTIVALAQQCNARPKSCRSSKPWGSKRHSATNPAQGTQLVRIGVVAVDDFVVGEVTAPAGEGGVVWTTPDLGMPS